MTPMTSPLKAMADAASSPLLMPTARALRWIEASWDMARAWPERMDRVEAAAWAT